MTGEWADNPGKTSTTTCGGTFSGADPTLCGLNPNVLINPIRTSFDSPMTGTPVPFPSGTAQVSTRAYLGDADGTLWRLDFSDPDPADWTAEIAWDSYNHSSVPNNSLKLSYVVNGTLSGFPLNMSPTPLTAATLGQPIEQPPIVSVDQRGVPTVTLVTGDGESFNVLSPGTVNLLTTFVDDIDAAMRFSPTISSTQGISMAFTDGGRVTGPPTLFDGKLFFSYFSPQTATVCTAGKSGWCGVDFLAGNNSTPVPVLDIDPMVSGLDRCVTFQNGEVVFGLAINAVPSCVVAEDNFNDQWLAGQYNSYSSSKGLSYQLVMQTSQGGTSENNSSINTTRVALPPPRAKTRLQSWVSVMQ
jgi:type IV pilus assembly protein PilY1